MDVNWTAIRRHLLKRDWSGCHLLIKLAGGTDREGLESSIDAAIAVSNALSERDHPEDLQVWAGGMMTSMKGPTIGLDWVGEGLRPESGSRRWPRS
jgi:hypothetical protein